MDPFPRAILIFAAALGTYGAAMAVINRSWPTRRSESSWSALGRSCSAYIISLVADTILMFLWLIISTISLLTDSGHWTVMMPSLALILSNIALHFSVRSEILSYRVYNRDWLIFRRKNWWLRWVVFNLPTLSMLYLLAVDFGWLPV